MVWWEALVRVLWVAAAAGAVAGISLRISTALGRRRERAPNSLATHAVMASLSIVGIYLASSGRWSEFGLGLGGFHWHFTLLLWAVPTLALTAVQVLGTRGRAPEDPFKLTPLQTVVRVWLVASIAEELFARGLVQGLLSPLSTTGFHVGRDLVSVSILLAALVFAALHLVLVRKMGAKAAPILVLAFLLGCVTGIYRQATGSLIPAVLVHALFNVGGALPLWVLPRGRAAPTAS